MTVHFTLNVVSHYLCLRIQTLLIVRQEACIQAYVQDFH